VLGYGAYKKYEGFLNKWIRWETAITAMQYLSYAKAKIPYMGVGRNLSYDKSIFFANKGFSSHSHLMSGDDDLFINQVATAKNTKISIHPESYTISEPKKSWDAYWFQKKRHMSTGKYYKPLHKFLLGLFNGSHFLFWAFAIWSLCFPKIILLAIATILVRWIVQFVVYASVFKKLQEFDLIASIWLYDIITLFYHLRLLPSVFIPQKTWK
jgi:hypothetical protein